MIKSNKSSMKCFLFLTITIILLLCVGCSTKYNESDSNTKNQSPKSDFSNNESQNDSFLSIQYNVEDYVENSLIVSKSGSLLYGVLDNQGKEIIPVKYDNIEFLNKQDYLKGLNKNLYIKAEYENTNYIFDQQGKEIFKTDNLISYANSYIVNIDAPFFIEHVKTRIDSSHSFSYYTGEEIWYSENMTEIARIKNDDANKFTKIKPFSDKCYYKQTCKSAGPVTGTKYPLATKATNLCIYIYDFNHNIINKFENFEYCFAIRRTGTEFVVCLAENDPNNITVFHLNENGETYKTENITYEKYKNNYYNPSPYNLYSSNGTYKLETIDGKTMYDERYYEAFNFEGQNDCKGLVNENNEIMLINRNGEKILDYGYLFSTSNDGKSIKLKINDQERIIENIHEGKSSIIITLKSSTQEGTDIYFFTK